MFEMLASNEDNPEPFDMGFKIGKDFMKNMVRDF
jgi:hypothetical protein